MDYLSYIRFRKEQYIIQTWHGGGSYKKVGTQTKNINYFTAKRRSYFNARTDAFISSSAIFTRDTIQGSFHFQGQILDYGMLRKSKSGWDFRRSSISCCMLPPIGRSSSTRTMSWTNPG